MKSKSSSDNTGLPFTQPMMVTSKVRSSSTCNKQEGNLQTWHNSLKTFLLLVCCRKTTSTWCLKITEKVALSIASEARYVYIHFEGIKLKMPKFKCDILSNFLIMWNRVNFEEKQNFMTAKLQMMIRYLKLRFVISEWLWQGRTSINVTNSKQFGDLQPNNSRQKF